MECLNRRVRAMTFSFRRKPGDKNSGQETPEYEDRDQEEERMGFGPLADRGNALAFLRVYIVQEIPHKKGDPPFEALVKKERAEPGNNTDDYGDDNDPFCRSNTRREGKFHGFRDFYFFPDPILVFLLRARTFCYQKCPIYFPFFPTLKKMHTAPIAAKAVSGESEAHGRV